MGLPKALKTDNAPAYTYNSFQEFCTKFQIKHNTGIPYNPQGQATVERAHQTLKIQIQKFKEGEFTYSSPYQILQHALFVINNLNVDLPALLHHWCPEQQNAKLLVKWKDLLSGQWKGPDPLLTSGQGYACVFQQEADSPIWVPDRLIRHVAAPRHPIPPLLRPQKRKGLPLPPLPLPIREIPLTSGRLTSEIPDEQGMDPPTRQVSQLHIQDIASPNPLPCRRPPGRPVQATQQASIPTWGQIKGLCHQAQGISSLQGSSASPEKVFIAMLALLSCQVGVSSPTPVNYWAYFPGPQLFK